MLAIILILPEKIFAAEAIPSPQKLYLNENETTVRGYNIEDYNYFKLRDLAVILKAGGINFNLDGDYSKIDLYKDRIYLEKTSDLSDIGNVKKYAIPKRMMLNLIEEKNTTAYGVDVYNIDGYNYFKLRDIGKILNFKVDYDENKNRALIYTKVEEENPSSIVLGNERLIEEYSNLIDNKSVGLITNQTGVDSKGIRTVDKIYNYKKANLLAIYSPEHGLDGKQKAGEYVESYKDEALNLPVYSLYGKTRKPTKKMLQGIDVLLFDIQDIGSRTYTYISTMNYAMRAAAENRIKFVVLDRPNPLGGEIVDGFLLEPKYESFVGVDEMPMAHGMTVGELAKFFNRKINCDLEVIEMKNYKRQYIWQDLGIDFPMTSPNIPNIESAFNYMATGIGDGTGIGQADKFLWVGGKNLDSVEFANKLNSYALPGVRFIPEDKNDRGGVKLIITDYHKFNPCRSGIYILATANLMTEIKIPDETDGKIPMFEKIIGTDKFGIMLKNKWNPDEMVLNYEEDLRNFKEIRKNYLIYN